MSSFTQFTDAVGMGLMAILNGVSSRLRTLFGCRKWMDQFPIREERKIREIISPHLVLYIMHVLVMFTKKLDIIFTILWGSDCVSLQKNYVIMIKC